MMGPLILAYNLDALAEARLQTLCARLRVRCRAVCADEYSLPLGTLAGIPAAGSTGDASAGSIDEPMLVMCFMLNDTFNAVLQGLRAKGMPRIPLKAVLTPTNVAWNSLQLYEELCREREAMRGGGAAHTPGGN